ncbi:EAL domain-containing protein [Conexibacter sp. DBS9H8]|uniref:sensor domain-containing phosphodiesterase n=1 Tax=Conexibacter sp. DBS9H8 TaxID=2937801 RepID=UPI00200F04BC|nr:EAL domain-containing protein [Conexibacter sp. DBS9H8]
MAGDEAAELDLVLASGSVRSLYQPIVELDSGRTVAWEALARGPKGSPLEFPDRLFAAAARTGRTAELDYRCRRAAVDSAVAAGLGTAQELFVNIEPEVAGIRQWAPALRRRAGAQAQLRVTIEITERALTAAPAELLALVDEYRRAGCGIAIDDVGADPRSIGLMPLLVPDVIKLDMAFVQQPMSRSRARVVHAVAAQAERSGARILAEGIENERQAARAQALGATLGQGWLFGRPGELRPAADSDGTGRIRVEVDNGSETPFAHLIGCCVSRTGTKARLLQMSLALEEQALLQGESAVLLSTFQEARYFPPSTRDRYASIAARVAFVGALGHGLDPEPAPGVRGSALTADDPLRQEWDVVVLGPHFAGAFLARDVGDDGADSARRFEYVVTYDRDLVVAAATRLMRRITPLAPQG